jgi:hypothetical protein
MKIRPVGTEFLHADRRTDMTKLIVAFRPFGNVSKKEFSLSMPCKTPLIRNIASRWNTVVSCLPGRFSNVKNPRHQLNTRLNGIQSPLLACPFVIRIQDRPTRRPVPRLRYGAVPPMLYVSLGHCAC